MRDQGFVLPESFFLPGHSPSHGSWKDEHPVYNHCWKQYMELSLRSCHLVNIRRGFFKTQLFFFIFLHTISPVLLILCVAVFKKQLLTIYGVKFSNTSSGQSVVTQTANWPGYRMSSLLDLRGVNPAYSTFVPH